MKDEPNNKKHLTPRQIINRYRKGVYVDESIEVISSVISSCGQTFDSIAVAFPTTLAERFWITSRLYNFCMRDRRQVSLSTI